MNKVNEIIYKLKNFHRGRKNSITYENLAFLLNLNERELRNIVSRLVSDYQVPIGSSQEGYFYISNNQEFQLAYGELISRIKALARRAKGLRVGWLRERELEKPKQLQMI
jgi:hypothetical protein